MLRLYGEVGYDRTARKPRCFANAERPWARGLALSGMSPVEPMVVEPGGIAGLDGTASEALAGIFLPGPLRGGKGRVGPCATCCREVFAGVD